MIIAGAVVAALMGGMAGATHQAMMLKATAGPPHTVVVVQPPMPSAPPSIAAPSEPQGSDD
jgi:hypothetical protein